MKFIFLFFFSCLWVFNNINHFSNDFFSSNFFFTYKVTIFKRSAIRRKLKPETYLLMEENGNVFFNTGFRIDVAYNEATDVLTFSPNGDYVRKAESPVSEVVEVPELEEDYTAGLTFEELDAVMKDNKE